jgi:hypothetical protein
LRRYAAIWSFEASAALRAIMHFIWSYSFKETADLGAHRLEVLLLRCFEFLLVTSDGTGFNHDNVRSNRFSMSSQNSTVWQISETI